LLRDKGAQYRGQISRNRKESFSGKAAKIIDKKTIIPKKVANAATDAVIKDDVG